MYSIRSIHNHGVATDAIENPNDERATFARQFRSRRGSWEIARNVALYCIMAEANAGAAESDYWLLPRDPKAIINRFFLADERWERFKGFFRGSGDVDRLRGLDCDDRDEFLETCVDLRRHYYWAMMQNPPTEVQVKRMMKTMIAIYGEECKSADDAAGVSEAKQLFDDLSTDRTSPWWMWYQKNDNFGRLTLNNNSMKDVSKAVAIHLYERFVD